MRRAFPPICPLLYLPLFLNDSVPEEHKAGIDMRRDMLRRSHTLIVCGSAVDEDVKNDIAVAGRLGIAATTLEGVLAVKGHGTPGHAGHLSWEAFFDGTACSLWLLPGAVSVPVWASEIEKSAHLHNQKALSRHGAFGGYYEGGRRENPAGSCNYLRFPLSEPFSDRQPLRPCRGKIKPVLSGVSYHTGNEGCY